MFRSSPTALIYLKSGSLEFYTLRSTQPHLLQFSMDGRNNFRRFLTDFIDSLGEEKHTAVILLDNELVESEVLPVSSPEEEEERADKFFSRLSGKNEQLVTKTLKSDDSIYLLAVDREKYRNVKMAFEGRGYKIRSVVPSLLFDEIDPEAVLGSRDILSKANFLESIDKKTNPILRLEVILTIVVLLLSLLIGFTFYNRSKRGDGDALPLRDLPAPIQRPKEATSSADSDLTATASANAAQVGRAEVKFQILNGSGIEGQAGFTREKLKALGYKVFSVDNAPPGNGPATKVGVRSSIPTEYKEEIVTELKKYFTSVEETPLPLGEDSEFDVVITTGRQL